MDKADRKRAVAGARYSRGDQELGLELFSRSPGSSVTAVRPPAGMDSGVIVKEFRNRFNAIITNGQGSMKGQIFRLAHLGYFDFHDLFAVIAELELILAANGHRYGLAPAWPPRRRSTRKLALPEDRNWRLSN